MKFSILKMKPVLALVLLLVPVLTGCGAAYLPTPTVTPVPPPTATSIPLGQQVTLVSADFKESQTTTPAYKITGQTPQLQGSNDPRVTAFNTSMQNLTQTEVDAFKKNMQDVIVIPEVPNSSFIFQYNLASPSGSNIISIKFTFEGFTSGAAHPYHYIKTVNYDLEKGQELTLDQVFSAGTDYLQIISDYCKTQLSRRDIGFEGFASGADPTPENYQNWNVTADGLLIAFNEYQVAPYAAGLQTVVVPYSELAQVIQQPGPLTPFLP